MLNPAKGSVTGDLAAQRRAKATEAFLAYRLSRSQLCQLMETDPSKWEDTFTAFTALDNDLATAPATTTVQQAVSELGLPERLKELSDDAVWTREDRALYRVMAHFEDSADQAPAAKTAAQPQGFFDVVAAHMGEWDRNGDNCLDAGELDLALSGGYYGERAELANEPEAAAALVTLMQKERLLAAAKPEDGEKLSTLDLMTARSMADSRLELIANNVALTYEETLERSQKMPAAKPVDLQDLDPRLLQQGVAGSCVLLSTTATLKKEDLQRMLQGLEDGSSKVAFADGAEETVRPLTLAERLYHSRGADGDTWPAVLETAVAQRLYTESASHFDSLRGAIDGVSPQDAVKLLSGQDTDQRMLDELSVNQTRHALGELLAYGGPILCGSRPNALGDFVSVEDLHNGIINGHAYSVLGYNRETDKVTLRNPWKRKEWKHQDSPDDGVFEMPMRDFYSSYRWIAAANGKPAA